MRVWEGMKRELIRQELSLYVRDDGRVKSCEKEDGCFVLNDALVFEQRDELSGDRKKVSLHPNFRNFMTRWFG